MTIKDRDKKVMVMPCKSSNCFQVIWRKRKKKGHFITKEIRTKDETRGPRIATSAKLEEC